MKARRGRRKADISSLPYTLDHLRLKLARYCRNKPAQGLKPGVLAGIPKSTTISMLEVSMISGIPRENLFGFKSGRRVLGMASLKRLCDALDLIESGRVQKLQGGKYIIHDEPIVAPIKEMRVSLTAMKIMEGVSAPKVERKMPSFDKLFG
jgi:hypothetical protein